MESETQEILDLDKVMPIETSSINLDKYDKKEVSIQKAEVIQVKSNFSKSGFQWVLKVSSEVLESFGEGDDLVEFRASELFNLIQDEKELDNGSIVAILKGYPTGETSNLMQFLGDLKIEPNNRPLGEIVKEIKTKKALVKSYEKTTKDNKKKTYLKFRY